MALPFCYLAKGVAVLPRRQLIGLPYKNADMILLLKVFDPVISVEAE
jgi:hypothetical protein